MNQLNALRRDIREIRELAREAHQAAGTMLLGGYGNDGWVEVARQYDEQAQRLEAVLRAHYRAMKGDRR